MKQETVEQMVVARERGRELLPRLKRSVGGCISQKSNSPLVDAALNSLWSTVFPDASARAWRGERRMVDGGR